MYKLSFAVVAFSLAGCAADPPPASRASAPAPKAEAKSDDVAKLTNEDCKQWADHFVGRLHEATARRVAECDKAAGGPVPSDAHDIEMADAEAGRLQAMLIDQCGKQIGAAYSASDAACFLSSKQIEDWAGCKFKSVFFTDYAMVARNHRLAFDERCRHVLSTKPGS